ncbi:PucR family transcriptional regulator [Halalkalibacter flavus]|uniref:PucR family transcriptional regulator n=1 Tax=Halalkalibacter flavus TaxID=3090668 RepID=UPI002FCB01E5
MLDKLKAHFGDIFIVGHDHITYDDNFYWFKTPDNVTIGFPIDLMHEKELDLLNIFLTPIPKQKEFSPRTPEEEYWSSILFKGSEAKPERHNGETFRFIYFQLKDELQEREAFTEAIRNMFPSKTIILWENESSGVIIDLDPKMTDTIENLFESIVDNIISDFFLEIVMYIGISNVTIAEANTRFYWEQSNFQTIKQLYKKRVYKGEEVLPFMLIGEARPDTLVKIREQTLKQVIEDPDLIQTIKVYLDCNMNVSLAAKKLYLHRNTLQYRVDKFIEKTGIDIRHFRSAVSIYLSLLIEKNIH